MPQKIGIIAIGDELATGRIINTTSSFAAQRLFENGYDIYGIVTIGDSATLIGTTIKETLAAVDVLIVTGGLGSTDDDITNAAVAKALDLPLKHYPEVEEAIGQPEKMAWLPTGAQPLLEKSKTAGYLLEYAAKKIFFLPGIPQQMRYLFTERVLPVLSCCKGQHVAQKIFRIFNLPEMEVNRRVSAIDFPEEVQIGYYPVLAEVHLSLTVRSITNEDTMQIFAAATARIEAEFAGDIYAYDQDTLEIVVGRLLESSRMTLATAESCTGGLIGKILTDVPGSSRYFLGGVISYANTIKTGFLGVEEEKIASLGAVSSEVAKQMAIGIRQKSGSDIGLSITGIAGPGGGLREKPVGTVYIGIATRDGCNAHHYAFTGERDRIRLLSTYTGLNLVREYLLKITNKKYKTSNYASFLQKNC